MPTSHSIGNHLHFLSLGARAARSYAAELPREAGDVAVRLDTLSGELQSLNARQEKVKQQLALLTREVKALKKRSCQERSRLIRLAEATFGPRDPRIKEFRPATEGQVRTARAPKATPAAVIAHVEQTPPVPERPAGPNERGPRSRSEPEPWIASEATPPARESPLPRPGHPPNIRLEDDLPRGTADPRARVFWWRPWSRRVDRRPEPLRSRAGADGSPAHDAASRGPQLRP